MPRHKPRSPPHERALEVAPDAEVGVEAPEPALAIPPDWMHGALLNVRNGGEHYVVTLYPEEYDHRSPERALLFPNPARCQDFVSTWYARQNHDPRAY